MRFTLRAASGRTSSIESRPSFISAPFNLDAVGEHEGSLELPRRDPPMQVVAAVVVRSAAR